jgi:hypothetical protein
MQSCVKVHHCICINIKLAEFEHWLFNLRTLIETAADQVSARPTNKGAHVVPTKALARFQIY